MSPTSSSESGRSRQTVRPARADHPTHLDGFHGAVASLEADQHAVFARLQRRRRDAPFDDPTELDEALGEDPLRAPLRQTALELEPTARPAVSQFTQRLQVRVEHSRELQVE